jgi:hypothetical protein
MTWRKKGKDGRERHGDKKGRRARGQEGRQARAPQSLIVPIIVTGLGTTLHANGVA